MSVIKDWDQFHRDAILAAFTGILAREDRNGTFYEDAIAAISAAEILVRESRREFEPPAKHWTYREGI